MQDLLNQHDLFRKLFEVMPTSVILVNIEGRVIAINSAGQKFFQIGDSEAYLRPGGEALRCVNAANPGDCGQTTFCQDCILRKSVKLAFEGQEISRNKGSFLAWHNGQPVRLDILVTATRLEYQGHNLALVIVEEISNITQLQGLLPICCSCHRIRNQEGNWTRLETFIEKHSEADFTHDLCPVCSEKAKQAAR
ncbi:MAG: hypothetical protein K0Q77_2001 [Anaerosporomusa subterranea]|nr:hypothetical protein [Anaerosporomusa subterranea]